MLWDYFESDFLPTLRKEVVAMVAAAQEGHERGVRDPAHRIKGSAATFGLKDVDYYVQRILGRQGDYLSNSLALKDSVENSVYIRDDNLEME